MSEDETDIGETSKYPTPVLNIKEVTQAVDEEFIDNYMRLPELWDPENAHYTNKLRRNAAHNVLLKILKKLDPTVTRIDVTKKINVLRVSYKKDLKRHLASKCVAPNGEEIYEYWPTNWKFHALRFLDNVKPISSQTNEVEKSVKSESFDNEASDNSASEAGYASSQASNSFEFVSEPKCGTKRRRQKIERDSLAEYDTESDHMIDREMEAIGANVTCKLKRMNSLQRYHAELLINKVLINGLKGNLTEETELTEVSR